MSDANEVVWPAFIREVEGTLAVNAQYVLYGSIRDNFLLPPAPTAPGHPRLQPLLPALWERLEPLGYTCIVTYDLVHGVTVYPGHAAAAAEAVLGGDVLGGRPSLATLRAHLAAVTGSVPPNEQERPVAGGTLMARGQRPRAAFVVDYASRIIRGRDSPEPAERDFFLFCQKMAETAPRQLGADPAQTTTLFNPVIWLVEGERDLPAWFTSGSVRIRSVAVPEPSLTERTHAAGYLATTWFGVHLPDQPTLPSADEPEELRQVRRFANQTDGLSLRAMEDIARLAADRKIDFAEIADAVRIYKLGIEENPWRRASVREQIRRGETFIRRQVLGQERAIGKTLDILKRAALGLSGAQAPSTGSRPRGILFFAGPTGVGKTELAKSVAQLLFGDASAYLRFDMSEFASDHAADRLIGAPPGYVGFEAGGELTGSVRRKPFQVVLFDEIEKAHPLVMDKFLQILEDGRLTDGQGVTTYFSECVLIFTSNLGVLETDPETKEKKLIVKPTLEYPDLEKQVRASIRKHFTGVIGRPELLNRFGDNIVVFGFISPEIAASIFDLQLGNVSDRLHREHQIDLVLDHRVRTELQTRCTADPLNGGRGIGNALETNLINPLARYLFDHDVPNGTTVTVVGLRDTQASGVELAITTTGAV